MTTYRIIGIVLIVIGIGMLFLGASLFTYQGPPLNPIVSKMGEYSFFWWLPTLIVGIGLTFGSKRKGK
ncbi:hypothetical protein SAMN05421821_103273 [Mucilaginibacter lappiensis]|uniref:DUF3098 domain-containing protein n=1 Tax=Mucilaginibacter lappiensis TaxID=354630 RepID=A0ABR6PLA8_9SPHI|nr:hypothetical protein [Mucilaginibacter lappiensis]SIQ72970.1 hypothetical protein SAMN05421821_103273 [Mucilaginibacter lappiensis]